MPKNQKSLDIPRIETDDKLAPREVTNSSPVEQDPGGLRSRIRTAIRDMMSGSAPEAEMNYQMTLRALASDDQAAVAAVSDIYSATPEEQYVERWSLVHLLVELRSGKALSTFDKILSTPIPPEKAPDMITYSTVGEEVMIRTTAIEGIARLAAGGDRQALDLLRKNSKHGTFSVKRAAIQAYLEAAGQGGRDELRKVLPAQDHFILDIQRAQVQDVPQPGIERKAVEEEKDQVPPARMPLRPKSEE